MSLELLHKVPTGAIETLFDVQNQPLFKKANLGKYLGIENIKHNFKEFPSHCTHPRLDLKGGGLSSPLGRAKNPHDIFINLDGSIEMAVQSKKTQGSCLSKMAYQERYRKKKHQQEEHQQAIIDPDNQIQVLDFIRSIDRKF